MDEYIIKSYDGTKLFIKNWFPDKRAIGIVTFVHGIGEHSGRYDKVARVFNDNGYIFNAFDLRGHGRSDGIRGFAASYDLLMEDVESVIKDIQCKSGNLPHILYGHSMGGNIVLNYVLKKDPPLVGVISSSPWLKLAFEPNRKSLLMGKILNVVYPTMYIKNGLKSSDMNQAIKRQEETAPDNYIHNKITPRLYFLIKKSGEWAIKNAGTINIPCLLMHGSSDKVTSYKASAEFASNVKNDCTFRLWEGLYHELHNEACHDDILNYIIDWANKQVI